jgi:RNA polymerase sigma factor (sigma-70 family)
MANAGLLCEQRETTAECSAHVEAERLPHLIASAQGGDSGAVEALLQQFRPLLRSRMHQVWVRLQERMTGTEWADVEAQVQLLFLTRLRDFRPQDGVYFPHYMARMLDLDCRTWIRQQQRAIAVPFSQLPGTEEGSDLDNWQFTNAAPVAEDTADAALHVEHIVSLHAALQRLTRQQRQVVWGCCVLGCTENEMAAQLGISRSAVRNRLSGALSRLRTFFEEEGKEAGPALFTTRTGRAASGARDKQGRGIPGVITMARDEKRPDLVGVGVGRPIMLQGVFEFEATGLKNPDLLSPKLSYTVPPGRVVGIRFFRAGVSCEKMVCLSTVVNGNPHRLFPVAPNSTTHVSLAIVEPIIAGSQIEIHIASEVPGTAIIDVGCLEMPA